MEDKNTITMTLRNLPNGGVEIKCDPSFEKMMHMIDSGHELTAAHRSNMQTVAEKIGKHAVEIANLKKGKE